MKIPTKSDTIYRELKSRIQTMAAGARLPSVRVTMRQFGVSQVTVDRAMRRLAKEGIIEKRVGMGTFVAGGAHRKNRIGLKHIAIAVPDVSSPVLDNYLELLRMRIEQNGDLAKVIRYDYRDRVPRTLPRESLDGLLFYPTASYMEGEEIVRLKKFGVPVVILDGTYPNLAVDSVSANDTYGGSLAADHLLKLGHRRLGILVGEPRTGTVDRRMEGFCLQARLMGVEEPQIYDAGTRTGEWSIQKAYEEMKQRIAAGALNVTGLFVVSDVTALGCLKACHETNIQVPEQISVIGFDGLEEGSFYHPSLTTIQVDRDKEARAALEILQRRWSGDSTPSIQKEICPKLITRDSTTSPGGRNI